MKIISFIVCVFFLLNSILSQNPQIYVEFELEHDLGKLAPGLNTEVMKKFNNIVVVYSYRFLNNYSEFQNIGTRKKDPSISGGSMTLNENTIDYKDFNKNTKYRISKSKPELISKDILRFDQKWSIDSVKKDTVLGYICYEARLDESGIPVVAWFAPDIPIPDGPLAYYGAPGLILRVKLDAVTITAVKLEIVDSVQDIKMPESENYLTPENFEKLIDRND